MRKGYLFCSKDGAFSFANEVPGVDVYKRQMLTAVTTTVSSVQQFLLEVTEKQNGCWHGVVSNISMKQIDEISKKKEVEKQVSIQNIGYAKLPHSKNETSPYLYIGGLNGDYETPVSYTHLF